MPTDREYLRVQRLGSFAAHLVNDDTFKEIIADLKALAIRQWGESLTPEKREECWRDLQAVARLETLLKYYESEYKVEAKKIADISRKQKAEQRYREIARG